ncbi:hypothetical protein [Deinococcus sp. QL22]|uniref:hypothetical protein n=1 Tax=Deinococcus sp. QL22 TaxID=2939437 RepID=UPI002017A3BC|nr:hypothetical protein [Deinococcus sp. QL22]UQN09952.1 hypothetical protein M1R55_27700 [Deinococcus sp. QL22]
MNQDERYGRHAERLKDWDEVEDQATDIGSQKSESQTRPMEPGAFNVEASDGSTSEKLPFRGAVVLQQNRFFIVGIAFILALVVMLFVLL